MRNLNRASGRITDVAQPSDEALLAGMANGDHEAASMFVRRYQARVYGLARTVVGGPALAEDVAQDAFVKAWKHAATYDPRRGRVSTWLLTITRNAAVDAVRYRREDPTDPDLLMAMLSPPEDSPTTHDQETVLTLRHALGDLPLDQRRPIFLMAFGGLTANEIAAQQEVPLGTVKSRVRRGLQRLSEKLGARDE